MQGATSGKQFRASPDLIGRLDASYGKVGNGYGDLQAIVEVGGTQELGLAFKDGQEIATLLQFAIREADLVEQENTGRLEPNKVVCMVDDAHFVGLGVANPDFSRSCKHT